MGFLSRMVSDPKKEWEESKRVARRHEIIKAQEKALKRHEKEDKKKR